MKINCGRCLRTTLLVVVSAALFTLGADELAGLEALKRGELDIAIRELAAPAEAGSIRAQVALGAALLVPGPSQDFKQAYHWFGKAADQESPEAMFLVGNMLLSGRGTKKDPRQAAKWFKRSALLDSGRAQASLGRLYWEGRGVPKDDEESVKWYMRAAEHGNLNAYMALALATDRGAGVLRNPIESLKWWSLAATSRNPQLIGFREAAKKQLLLSTNDVAKAENAVRDWQQKYGTRVDAAPVFLFEK